MEKAPEVYGRPPWKIRRRIVNLTLIICAGMVLYLLVFGQDNELHRSIVMYSFSLAGLTIASYVFGAAWDDANVMRTLGPKAYQDQVPMLPDDSRPADAAWPADVPTDEELARMDAGTMRDAP
jgi:hypothetical protein